MLNDVSAWIETHEITVGLLKGVALVLLAWVSGFFAYLRRYKTRPYLEIVEKASFVFVEQVSAQADHSSGARASFVINASLVNASNERIVLDRFELSFQTLGFWRSYKQRLLRIAFPSRPRKQIGESVKYMGVWFTDYPLDELKMEVISGALDPKDFCAGYLLFTSFTYGSWNPKFDRGFIRVRLRAKLTSKRWVRQSAKLRVIENPAFAEEFSPGFIAHVAHESTWNHDLSIRDK